MEKLLILIPIGIILFLIWAVRSKFKNKERSAEIIKRLTPIIEDAKNLEEVNKAWDLLYEECTDKIGKRTMLEIDIAYRDDFMRLNTICLTKHKMLSQ